MKTLQLSIFFWLLAMEECASGQATIESTLQQVLSRFIGNRASDITFKSIPDDPDHPGKMVFEVDAKNGKIVVSGNSVIAQLRGAYTYLKEATGSMITWSGQHIEIPDVWPDYSKRMVSPYKYTLQDNVCVFGYTTPYFKWPQWQRYLDVMALYGYNMMYVPKIVEYMAYLRALALAEVAWSPKTSTIGITSGSDCSLSLSDLMKKKLITKNIIWPKNHI